MECPLCFECIESDNVVNTECKHIFCRKCFFKWRKHDSRCALCRNELNSLFWSKNMTDEVYAYNDLII